MREESLIHVLIQSQDGKQVLETGHQLLPKLLLTLIHHSLPMMLSIGLTSHGVLQSLTLHSQSGIELDQYGQELPSLEMPLNHGTFSKEI